MKRRKYKIKWKNVIILSIFVISISIFIIYEYKTINWYLENKSINEQIDNITSITTVIDVIDSDNTVIIESDEDATNPYWDYISMNLIDVDFSSLKEINEDVVGWVQVNGTNINYPFVQTTDNSYYLKHSLDKSYNTAGWVFMDYRNSSTTLNKNTILYAHGRVDSTMFGSLKNILEDEWLEDSNNYVVKLVTEDYSTLWQVFSIYHIETTSDYLQVEFSEGEFDNFVSMLINRSMYNFNTTVSTSDKILTLSTCYSDTEKMVLHAKLIKYEKK